MAIDENEVIIQIPQISSIKPSRAALQGTNVVEVDLT